MYTCAYGAFSNLFEPGEEVIRWSFLTLFIFWSLRLVLLFTFTTIDNIKREITMASPLNLRLKIRIDYLDEDLLEVVLKYGGDGEVDYIKKVLVAIADSLDTVTKTDNKDIWESYEKGA